MQQLSGIDALLFYAPTLFLQAGIEGQTAVFLASGVSGLVNIVGTCTATPFMDRMGRKTALISGGVIMGSLQMCVSDRCSSPRALTPLMQVDRHNLSNGSGRVDRRQIYRHRQSLLVPPSVHLDLGDDRAVSGFSVLSSTLS